jgi:hypothetical protein
MLRIAIEGINGTALLLHDSVRSRWHSAHRVGSTYFDWLRMRSQFGLI